MQPETTLDELIGQLETSAVAFGTDNPVNDDLRNGLESVLNSAEANIIDPAAVVVLEQTPEKVALLRDLAQDIAHGTEYSTVLVRTPHTAVGVSEELSRAQIETGERAMMSHADYVQGLEAFIGDAGVFSPMWTLIIGALLVALAFLALASWRSR